MSKEISEKFKGVGVALVTPFHKYGTVDFTSLEKIVQNVLDGGVDYLVCLGTTSEAATLSSDERNAVVSFIVDQVDGRVPIVMGLGTNNTQEAINYLKSNSLDGIDAILSVAPFYNKPNQKGLYAHYKSIASACPKPIILYNVPSRTASNIDAETVLKLANDFDNIIAVKEASGDFEQCMEIIQHRPKDFLLLSGDDKLTLPLMSCGADGVISVVANVKPFEFSQMVKECAKGDFVKAREWHYPLCDLISALFADGNPAGIKAALSIEGLCQNNLRLPLVKVNKTTHNQLATVLDVLGR